MSGPPDAPHRSVGLEPAGAEKGRLGVLLQRREVVRVVPARALPRPRAAQGPADDGRRRLGDSEERERQ